MIELRNYVDSIAADLRALYEADFSDEEREEREENGEPCDLYDYFADVLDVDYIISSSLDFLGARIAVALGGPNIYIDTYRGEVSGYWGCDQDTAWMPPEICAEIDSIFEEAFRCAMGAAR